MKYRELCRMLKDAGIETAEWDAKLMLEQICGADESLILCDPDRSYDSEQLQDAVKRRVGREPLQYILGEWEFYRQKYEVSPDCLIPRSDTEILVEEAVRRLPMQAEFADFCTGSGCIAISTLAERSDTRAVAVDVSRAALEIAERNAEKNGVSGRLSFRLADLLKEQDSFWEGRKPFDAILSNPPYIRTEVLEHLEQEVKFEPEIALDGGSDGLIFYRALLKLAGRLLKPDGFCLFEIGYDQGADLMKLAEESGFSCSIRKDYHGCDRVAILHRAEAGHIK